MEEWKDLAIVSTSMNIPMGCVAVLHHASRQWTFELSINLRGHFQTRLVSFTPKVT
jgi:hypothetical protein